jgi:hypothetical protein
MSQHKTYHLRLFLSLLLGGGKHIADSQLFSTLFLYQFYGIATRPTHRDHGPAPPSLVTMPRLARGSARYFFGPVPVQERLMPKRRSLPSTIYRSCYYVDLHALTGNFEATLSCEIIATDTQLLTTVLYVGVLYNRSQTRLVAVAAELLT